jgi:type I restriction-modification system DNA methylase subunit
MRDPRVIGSCRMEAVENTKESLQNHASFIWSVADLLRGDYKQSEYGKVILPLTVIRRLDCVLEPTKPAVLDKHKDRPPEASR